MTFPDYHSKRDICITLSEDHRLCWKGKKALEMCQYPVMPQRISLAEKKENLIFM